MGFTSEGTRWNGISSHHFLHTQEETSKLSKDSIAWHRNSKRTTRRRRLFSPFVALCHHLRHMHPNHVSLPFTVQSPWFLFVALPKPQQDSPVRPKGHVYIEQGGTWAAPRPVSFCWDPCLTFWGDAHATILPKAGSRDQETDLSHELLYGSAELATNKWRWTHFCR